jgi:hypothetical protein
LRLGVYGGVWGWGVDVGDSVGSGAEYAVVGDLVAERTEGQTVVEESPVGSSGGHGVVERAVQEVEGDMRALLLGLGILVGIRNRSGEIWVSTRKGKIEKVRTVKRIPVEDRWGKDNVDWVRRVMWNKYHVDEFQDGALLEGWDLEVEVGDSESGNQEESRGDGTKGRLYVQEPVPRDFYLKKEDVMKHGVLVLERRSFPWSRPPWTLPDSPTPNLPPPPPNPIPQAKPHPGIRPHGIYSTLPS